MGRSIWTNIGQCTKKVATHFEVSGIYYSMFVFCWPRLLSRAARPEPLIVQIIILIRNVTMACLFCTGIRRDSRLFYHFVPCMLDSIVRHFWAVMSSEILTFCRLHIFHVWYVSIIQYFGQECKLYVDGSMFWIEPTATHFMQGLWF